MRCCAGRVLLPLLGDQYGEVLERGELKLAYERDRGSFAARYYEHRLPVDPSSYAGLLERALAAGAAAAALPEHARARDRPPGRRPLPTCRRAKLSSPPRVRSGSMTRSTSSRRWQDCRKSGRRSLRHSTRWSTSSTATSADPASFETLDALLDAQAYRLAFWRVAGDEINYRRFFDINELAALRVEEPAVFDATHRLIFDLVAAGQVDGLRIDHPDGLLDPAGYFRRLQQTHVSETDSQVPPEDRPLYVVAEKIIAPHEQLPDWPLHGTTGYRFLNVVTGLLVDASAKGRLDRVWRAFVGDEAEHFEELAYRGRQLVLASTLAGELAVMTQALLRLARADRRTRDFTLNTLRRALAQVLACFPVYRTYIVDAPSAADRRFIDWAVGMARRRSPAVDHNAIDFVHDVLLGRAPPRCADSLRDGYLVFARRMQQLSAPVAAKGIEDTAFYLHHRLIALNEVGGEPEGFGIRIKAFHGASRDRAARWPHTLLATSTHDTKRSEDVRARIAVISESPAAWRLAVRRWSRMNRSYRRTVAGAPMPSRNDEYLLYQTLIGTLPTSVGDEPTLAAYRARIQQYMLKAVREGKRDSSWIAPDAEYERSLAEFIDGLLGRLQGNLFLDDLRQAAAAYAWYGAFNTLSMTVLKLTSPGVPDIYQGQQMLDLSLVDPDNRRPVDYAAQDAALNALAPLTDAAAPAAAVAALLADPGDGRAKLWATWRLLQLRSAHPDLFAAGDYTPIEVVGATSEHVVAFMRRHGNQIVVVAAGRLFAKLGVEVDTAPVGAHWGDASLDLAYLPPDLTLRNVLTGEVVTPQEGGLSLGPAFSTWPVAVLHAASGFSG
jgi:(1->4)-alpha-D-glucan 1-alpha-D-glucosylmutase